jgi:hypothetical protein
MPFRKREFFKKVKIAVSGAAGNNCNWNSGKNYPNKIFNNSSFDSFIWDETEDKIEFNVPIFKGSWAGIVR